VTFVCPQWWDGSAHRDRSDAKALVRNVARSDQERTLIDKVKQMERFRALYFCEGRRKPSLMSLLAYAKKNASMGGEALAEGLVAGR
jgi:hypothetical protein